MPYSPEAIEELYRTLASIRPKYFHLLEAYASQQFTHRRALEYATHGFLRRLKLLVLCIENVFKLLPPELKDVPGETNILNAEIFVQAFIFNLFGSIDNLAWIWVYEQDLREGTSPIRNSHVGLGPQNSTLRDSLSSDFRSYLQELDQWFRNLEDYRHALAHRIPLYIPPFVVLESNQAAFMKIGMQIRDAEGEELERLSKEQMKLAVFDPIINHSFEEKTQPLLFHSQLLADFLTIEQIAWNMITELRSLRADKSDGN